MCHFKNYKAQNSLFSAAISYAKEGRDNRRWLLTVSREGEKLHNK